MTYFDCTITAPAAKTFLAFEQTIFEEHLALALQVDTVCRALSKTPLDVSDVVAALQLDASINALLALIFGIDLGRLA
jgi:hypothetical protein